MQIFWVKGGGALNKRNENTIFDLLFLGQCKDKWTFYYFRDIFPVLRNPAVFQELLDVMVEQVKAKAPNVELIVGLESRGFLFGPSIALKLNCGFAPVRKKGKLPGEKETVAYALEYGTVELNISYFDKRTCIRVPEK